MVIRPDIETVSRLLSVCGEIAAADDVMDDWAVYVETLGGRCGLFHDGWDCRAEHGRILGIHRLKEREGD